jgi:putative hydrolase of the HAD superfamily
MKISAVLFDLDDTLIDHTTAIEQAAAALFDKVVPDAQTGDCSKFTVNWKILNRDWYQRFYAQQVTFEESGRGKLRDAFLTFDIQFHDSDADALLEQYYENYVSTCLVFDDVIPCLSRLRKFKLGVVTNGQERQQVEKIKRCALDSWLPSVLTSEAAGVSKPDSRIFVEACSRLAAKEGEVVYVGDSLETDAVAASRAGLTGIWLNRGSDAAAGCPPEVRQIRDLCGLVKWLQYGL